MDIALLVIGDEIRTGKRQDQHFQKAVELLRARGLELAEARIVGDDEERIAWAMRDLRDRDHAVLSVGGIGATPDDCTRQAAARAFALPIERHAGAAALIEAEYGGRAYPNRLLMADFPAGADLIPNPVNRVAGFFIGHVYCVPGFPEMAWPMLAWVLDHPLRHLRCADPPVEFSLRVMGTDGEGELLDLMEAVLAKFPGVSLSSLPTRGDAKRLRHIEFGIKGPAASAATAFRWFETQLRARGELDIEHLRVPPG